MKKIIKDAKRKRPRVVTVNEEPTMAMQQYKDSCDVNKIMKRYKETGTISHLRNAQNGVYMDLTELPDYAEALMQIKRADEAFKQIPAEVRLKFNNDPSQLITYLQDSKNHEEAIKYGLLVPKQNDEQNPKPNDETKPNSNPQQSAST